MRSGSGVKLGGEYRAAGVWGDGVPRGVPNIESVASPLPPLHCLLDYSTYTSVCGEKADLSAPSERWHPIAFSLAWQKCGWFIIIGTNVGQDGQPSGFVSGALPEGRPVANRKARR
jgi:hypothetical protein